MKQTYTITPPLAFQGRPIRAVIDSNRLIWLDIDDLQQALQTGPLETFPNLLPAHWIMTVPGDDGSRMLLELAAVYRMKYLTTQLLNPMIGMAFDGSQWGRESMGSDSIVMDN